MNLLANFEFWFASDFIDGRFPKPHRFEELSRFESVLKISPDENPTNQVLQICSNSKKIAKKSLGSLVTLFTNSLTSPSIYSQSSHTSCLITFFFGEVKGNSMKPANRIVFTMHLPPIQALVACAQRSLKETH
jgi:hypothetical protein